MPAERPDKNTEGQQDLLDQMRQSLGLLRVAFDSTDEAMLIVDHQQIIRWANQKAADCFSQGMTALLVGKDLGERVAFGLPGEHSAEKATKQPLQRVFKTNQGERRLLISAATDGVQAPQNMLSMVIWKQITNLNELFVLVIIRDLDPAERALHEQRTFLQSVAHELRTPPGAAVWELVSAAQADLFNSIRPDPSENRRSRIQTHRPSGGSADAAFRPRHQPIPLEAGSFRSRGARARLEAPTSTA